MLGDVLIDARAGRSVLVVINGAASGVGLARCAVTATPGAMIPAYGAQGYGFGMRPPTISDIGAANRSDAPLAGAGVRLDRPRKPDRRDACH